MAITVTGALPVKRFADLEQGEAFVEAMGDMRLFGMKVLIGNERFVLFFGSRGTENDAAGAGLVSAAEYNETVVIPIGPVRFRVDDGDGYGVPADSAANGAIIVDNAGAPFFLVKPKHGEVFLFDLATGVAGKPDRNARYNSWELVWDKPGAKQPTVLYAQGKIAKAK